MISIYDAGTVDFNNNGITSLNPSLCEVEEQRNGLYELVLEHPFDDRGKWKNLVEGNVIKAPTPMGNQFFRIYKKNKNMSGIKVNARHIFYDLIDNFIEDSRAANTDGKGALNIVLTSTQYPHRFTSMSDLSGSKTAHFIEKNPVEAIFSEDGIIDTWGGELERDNFLIKLLQNRGKDRGVTIRYGKNLLGIDEDLSLDSVVTRIIPQGYGGLSLPEKYVDSDLINNYPHPKIRNIEYSDIKVDEKSGVTEAMAIAKLRERAQQEFTINKIDIPPANYKVDFLELSKTEEYKNYAVLERVYLCDTVTVKHLKYGFDLNAKVIKYKYDCLSNRYKEIELGSFKDNIVSTLSSLSSIRSTVNEILQNSVTGTKMQEAIDNATSLLTGAFGGNIVFRPKDKPEEILIMDTEDIMTAKSVWRWNINGLGYSKTGINGPYETAITMDGKIVGTFILAESIKANQLAADVGQYLELSSNEGINAKVSKDITNAIDNLNISGRNLVSDTSFNNTWSRFNNLGDVLETNDGLKFTFTSASQMAVASPLTDKLIEGRKYILRLMVRGTLNRCQAFILTKTTPDFNFYDKTAVLNSTNFTEIIIPFTYDSNSESNKLFIGGTASAIGQWIEIQKNTLKLEEGDKATGWSPAPEDIQEQYTKLDGNISDIVGNLTEINSSVESHESKLNLLDTAFNVTVKENYVAKTDFQTFQEVTSTNFEQTSKDFTFKFEEMQTLVSEKDGETKKQFKEIDKYIRFVDGDIILGQEGQSQTQLTLKISHDRISFIQGGKEVAYFSDNQIYIKDAEVLNSLKLGKFAFKPRDNGNLSFIWGG